MNRWIVMTVGLCLTPGALADLTGWCGRITGDYWFCIRAVPTSCACAPNPWPADPPYICRGLGNDIPASFAYHDVTAITPDENGVVFDVTAKLCKRRPRCAKWPWSPDGEECEGPSDLCLEWAGGPEYIAYDYVPTEIRCEEQ